MTKWKKLKKGKPRKQTRIVQSVNPVAMSTGGMSGGWGDPMPPAIHGTVSEESNGIKWIPIKKDA